MQKQGIYRAIASEYVVACRYAKTLLDGQLRRNFHRESLSKFNVDFLNLWPVFGLECDGANYGLEIGL
jgi:hypothetical protein